MAERAESMESMESTETTESVESPGTVDNQRVDEHRTQRVDSRGTVDNQRIDEHCNQRVDNRYNASVRELRNNPNYQMFLDSFMRKALPENLMITTDAKEAIEGCVIAGIDFISVKANEKCQSETRGMVTADDIVHAMTTARFDDYLDHLYLYMRKYWEYAGLEASTANEYGEASSAVRMEEGEEERGATPEVVDPVNMPPPVLAGDPPTGGYAASTGAPLSEIYLATKTEGEEEGGTAPELDAPEHTPPPALALDPPIGGDAASTAAPPSELDLTSSAFDQAPQ